MNTLSTLIRSLNLVYMYHNITHYPIHMYNYYVSKIIIKAKKRVFIKASLKKKKNWRGNNKITEAENQVDD